jgi:acetyl esterase/lipase
VPLDARVSRFLSLLAAGKPPDARSATVEERRAGLAALMQMGRREVAAEVGSGAIAGPGGSIKLRLYAPSSEPVLPGLIYFHGGGLVAGSLDTHDAIARELCQAGACRVVAVDYRLAPEHPFPAGLEDAVTAIRSIIQEATAFGLDPERIGVCGDSAGATLVSAACHELAGEPPLRVKLQLLLCPILDYSQITDSKREFASGYLVDQATLDHDLKHLLPAGVTPSDPRVSPLLTPHVQGLPPTLIHTAEFDPLRDEGHKYFERLAQNGVQVSYTCHPGMIHLFYGLGAVIPYARQVFLQLGQQLRTAFA